MPRFPSPIEKQHITPRALFVAIPAIMDRSLHTEPISEDLLSELPADVLVSILEKLSLRDCVRAGVLSRRWRWLSTQVPSLALQLEDYVEEDDWYLYDDVGNEDDDEGGDDLIEDCLAEASTALLRAATAVLSSRAAAGAPVRTLAMDIMLRRNGNYMSLGRLLDGAVAGGEAVRAVDLWVATTCRLSRGFDMEHAMEVWTAHGRRFRALFDGCPAAFAAVTRLTLWNIVLDPANLGDILATCTRMETLSLRNCDGGTLQRWRAVRHARLTHLTAHCCCFGGIDLEWAPRLECVAYRAWLSTRCPPLSFGHVPRLATVIMSKRCRFYEPTVRLSQTLASTAVTDLRLNFRGESIWVKPEAPKRFINVFDISIFRNLKHLKIRNVHEECGLSWTYFLLQAAPALKELYIKLWDHKCKKKKIYPHFPDKRSIVPWEVPIGFKHYSLAQLTIRSLYITGDTTVAYKRRMVEVAVNLEEIDLCERAPCKRCGLTAEMGLPRISNENR
ncbi:hypothetical protein ACP4OV_018317 [Aristida adscensionis]